MEKKGGTIDHYTRFALRWKYTGKLKKERVTLILSPHLDDVLLSLYSTILSGKLGKNIIVVNFFTSTDDEANTNIKTDFGTIVKSSRAKIRGELNFADHLLKKGINYLPIFLGLKDAAIEKYYRFIASAEINKLPTQSMKKQALKLYSALVSNYTKELKMTEMLAPLFQQFGYNIDCIVAPMGVGTHIDHSVLAHAAKEFSSQNKIRFGLYAEIPYVYLSDNLTLKKIQTRAPADFTEVSTTKFDANAKDKLLKELFPTQYNKMMKDSIFAAEENVGEVILWKKERK
jgi:hypothetical protein